MYYNKSKLLLSINTDLRRKIMGMNLMNIMKTVQKAQGRAVEVQKELEELEITGSAGNGAVTIISNGQGKFKAIKISPDAISSTDSDSIEMLEDLISTAMNQINEQSSKVMAEKMKKVTGGINIPGLNF